MLECAARRDIIGAMPRSWDDSTLTYAVCQRCRSAQIFGERRAAAAEVERWFLAHRCGVDVDDEAALAWVVDDISGRAYA